MTQTEIEAALENIAGHLGAALTQALPSDDQIIIHHIDHAYACAKRTLRQMGEENSHG